MPWILIGKENKKGNTLVPAFMQISSLTMSVGKMSSHLENVRRVQYPLILLPIFFTSLYLFYSSRPFLTFFLLLSLCLSLSHAKISLRPIEHHRKKASRFVRQFSTLKRAFSDSLKKKRKIAECPIHAGFFYSKYGYIYVKYRWFLIGHWNYYDSITAIMLLP